jgi:RNA polymerase sigma factor (sigma-70 family)
LTGRIENIIEGCRRKNQDAQRLLYEMFSATMFGVCLRYAGSRDDAQDILHEGFLKIFEKIGQFESRGSFEGWIRRIMVNTALEKYRNDHKSVTIQEELVEYDPHLSTEMRDNVTEKELLRIIEDLTPQYRIVFNLYAIEGYSHKEISEMLEISEGTSKSNLSRARAILQEKVKEFYKQEIRIGY